MRARAAAVRACGARARISPPDARGIAVARFVTPERPSPPSRRLASTSAAPASSGVVDPRAIRTTSERPMPIVHKITPCLWFDDQAEEAAAFYTSIFKHSKTLNVSRYGEAGREVHRRPAGSVMAVAFELEGQGFTALNGGPLFKFNE